MLRFQNIVDLNKKSQLLYNKRLMTVFKVTFNLLKVIGFLEDVTVGYSISIVLSPQIKVYVRHLHKYRRLLKE